MAWIYQLVDVSPLSLGPLNLKVGATMVAMATQVHLSLTVKVVPTVITWAAVPVVRVVVMLVPFPHIKVFCGQPTIANSILLFTPLPMICWALTSLVLVLVIFL
jgi:hypothetical protein